MARRKKDAQPAPEDHDVPGLDVADDPPDRELVPVDLTQAELRERGRERRWVDVRTVYDLDRSLAQVVRCDTGEIVRVRPMTHAELGDARQARLFVAGSE